MQDADNIPDLKPCPFCGRKAVYMGYDLRDPISGKPRSRIMIGCPAAFTARGDWGDDHEVCPVAPMIDSLVMLAGTDIVAAWNRRAEDFEGQKMRRAMSDEQPATTARGKVFMLHEKTAGGEWWHEFQTEEQRRRYMVESRIWAHYEHAREKHPHFCDRLTDPHVEKIIDDILAVCRKGLKTEIEENEETARTILYCESLEMDAAIAHGDAAAAVEECYDCIAVLLRIVDVLEGRQSLGRPEGQGAAQ